MPLKLHEFNIESVYDDSQTDYLYSRVTVLVEAVVNGQGAVVLGTAPGPAISYKSGSGGSLNNPGVGTRSGSTGSPVPGPIPPQGEGLDIGNAASGFVTLTRAPNAPPLTHSVIRQRLAQPQGQLYIFNGPGQESGTPAVGGDGPPGLPGGTLVNICVQSPVNDALIDCNNGPKPHLFNVIGDHGDGNTYAVMWGCETFINEAEENGLNPVGALVSNRFSQTHVVDEDGYTTITTEGTGIFRTDLVYSQDISPDALRASMFIPCPLSFTRKIDYVRGMESVAGVRYGYTDTQVKSNFVAGSFVSASKISAVHRQAVVTNSDILGGALDVYERYLGRKANKNIAEEKNPHVPPSTPGGPGAGRLRVPGAPVTPSTPKSKPRRK